MSVVVRDGVAGAVSIDVVPARPSWLLGVFLDALLGVSAYIVSYWLRFGSERLAAFLPGAWSTVPLVVGAQILALGALRAYAPKPKATWLSRVVAGIVLGTAASALLVRIAVGFQGISRMAFLADALLLSIAAIGWRGVWVLRTRARARALSRASVGDLVDRADEMTLGVVLLSIYRYRTLIKTLVLKDLKLKYRGSVFGFLWSLANPLLMIVVYTLAFTFILGIRSEMFVFYLMLGQLAWTFFASSTMMSTASIVDNTGLLRTVQFPRAILPIATVLFNFAQYLLTIAVFLPIMIAWYGIPLAEPMILFPAVLVLHVAFTIGTALLFATTTVFFRDVRHLVEVALAVLFWTTPIVYELDRVPERLRLLILLSPMSPFVVLYQKLFFFREWPDATVWLVAGTYAVGAFVIGGALLLAFEDRFTEQV
ncbi:MAG TPA: ABC transporter permease [Vicinamibacterales bacterium]|jgi:homopolymeric O-antigen transport system permease protein|nr:ABC transporter permease [Vicinamibacterales bacterium]